MKAKTRRKIKKSKVNEKFCKGSLKLSANVCGRNYKIKRQSRFIKRDGFFIHTLTLLDNLNVSIDRMCGKKFRTDKYNQNRLFKKMMEDK